ncbi:hypothetical protein LWI28_029198 [Acer negundo]|uniref:aspartate kinase n=1 Tax=Acer negundo TaxID=4023 RepID=A0AAD5J2D1_ACENE|nr:hypothetical protein LWI28_029198 [Acer negundo]
MASAPESVPLFSMPLPSVTTIQANNFRAIAQDYSEYNIIVVIKREDCIRALRAAHSMFLLSRTTKAMVIIGLGLIGATLLDQLRGAMDSFTFKKFVQIGVNLVEVGECDVDHISLITLVHAICEKLSGNYDVPTRDYHVWAQISWSGDKYVVGE